MVSKIKKGITFIVLLITSICFSQNECIDFKDFEESQEWIKKVNSLNPLDKKDEILNRINCERVLNNKMNCNLLFIINGYLISSNSFSKKELKILELIQSEKFVITKPMINYCKCTLAFVIINQTEEPILNEINTFTFNKIKRRKKKIILSIISEETTNIKIKREMLFPQENRIVLRTTNRLDLIEIKKDNKISLILK